MPRMLGLLRGVNLGATRKVSMADLREAMLAGGFRGVATHLQSGNVVFEREDDLENAALRLKRLILERFGLDVPVLVREPSDLRRVLEANPLRDIASDLSRYLVAFLSEAPDAEKLRAFDPAAFHPDAFAVGEREIYLWYPNGVHQSRLTVPLLERRLGLVGTARNWNTLSRLLELLEA